MIKSFSCKKTKELHLSSKSRHFDSRIISRAIVTLDQLDQAEELNQLRIPPSNHLEALKGDYKGYHSMRVSGQWRLCFRWNNGQPKDVHITDYH